IEFELSVKFHLLAGQMQGREICFGDFRLEVEFWLGRVEIDKAVEVRIQVWVAGDQFAVEPFFGYCAVHLDMLVGIVVEVEAVDHSVQGSAYRACLQARPVYLSLEGHSPDIVIIEEGAQLETVGGDGAGVDGGAG